ncbi:MAG: hypothetical protein JWL73_850 [Actinomycetia bacterium]|nr:hypothetical protein [Actinomycetes bacterium]
MSMVSTDDNRILVRKPTAAPSTEPAAPTFTVDGPIEGRRVGFRTDSAWRSWSLIADVWNGYLQRDGATTDTYETHGMIGDTGATDRAQIDKLAETVDFAIVGLGTCGSCTSFTIADSVAFEDHEKPVIAIVTEEFATHGHNVANHLGHGDLKVLVLPYPLEALPHEELLQIADDFYPKALELLGVTK